MKRENGKPPPDVRRDQFMSDGGFKIWEQMWELKADVKSNKTMLRFGVTLVLGIFVILLTQAVT